MKSSRTRDFQKLLVRLPQRIKETAKKNYELWKENPFHRSLEFIKSSSRKIFGLSESELDGEHWEL